MSIVFDNDLSYKPWKVIRNGKIDTKHKHHALADQEIKDNGGDEIRYINNRGFWVTVWTRPAPPALVADEPAYR